MAKIKSFVSWLFCFLINIYRYSASSLFPNACRFYPSCSSYALEAIRKKGPVIGSFLTFKRICRCHPFNKGGYDPVEPT